MRTNYARSFLLLRTLRAVLGLPFRFTLGHGDHELGDAGLFLGGAGQNGQVAVVQILR